MKEKKKLGLGVWIMIGLAAGIAFGAILWAAMGAEAATDFTASYLKPFGDIFVNLLKFIVVPLVLLSIMDGMFSMGDIGKVGKIGWKTVVYFLATTAVACVIGLVVANLFKGSFPVLSLAEDAAYEAKESDIMTTIKNIFPSNSVQPMIDASMLQIIVIALLFGGTAVDRMSACIINGILCLLTENTVSFVFARLHGICPGEVWRYRTCLAALVISILLVGILVARFLCRWNHCSALDPLQALLMSFFPGVVVLLNIFIMISSNRRVPTLLDLMLTVGLTIAVLVHLAIVQMFNDQVVQGQASHFQAALEQQRAEALMESYTAQRRLTHEFTNHIAALDALLRQGDLTGAQEYLSSVSKVVAAGTTILDTHNPLLDSLLSRKYEEAAQQGVELYFDLCDLKDLPFCGTDLVIVISNLLDNAIRAAAQAKPPEVYLRARRNEEEYLISVRNRVQKDLELVDGELPRSTKAEPGHGMGLVNVREVLDRCRCEYTLSCRDRWFRFTCAVPTRKL